MLISDFKSYFKHKTFSDYLNYFTIQNSTIFHNNGDMTAIIEAYITKIDERAIIEDMNKKICDYFEVLPTDTEVVFYLNRVPDNRKVIIRGGPSIPIVHFLNKRREEFFNANGNMITLNHIAVTLKHKKTASDGGEAQASAIRDKLQSVLKGSDFKFTKEAVRDNLKILDGAIEKLVKLFTDDKGNALSKRLDDTEIVRFLSLIINHEEDSFSRSIDDIFNGDFVFNRKEKNVFYNGRHHAYLTIRKKGAPKAMNDDYTKFLFSEEVNKYPFMVLNSIRLTDKEKEIEQIQSMRGFSQALINAPGMRRKRLQLEQEIANFNELEYVCREEHFRIVELSWTVMVWADDQEQLEFIINQFHTLASSNGFIFTVEDFNLPSITRSIFPGHFSFNEIRFKMLTGNSRCLFPIMSTPIITENPKSKAYVYFYNKFGEVVKFDTFDSRNTNWNFLIVGSSGSGKSFFTNQLLFQQLTGNPKILIVDKGGSYRRLIENLGGTYIAVDFTRKDDFSINFFDGPYTAEKEIFLIAMLEQMIIDKSSQYISKSLKAIIQPLIKQAYEDTNDNENDVLSLDVFVEHYMRSTPQTKPLCASLEMYVKDGTYAAFFKKTKIQKTFEYVCFDLDGLGNNPDIMPIIALAVVNLIWQSIITDIKRRKIIVIDEAWAALKDSNGLANFIDEIYRTARKHNACIGLVTQSFRDILQTSLGAGIKTNTSYFYLLRNKDDAQTLTQIEDINQYTFEDKIKKLMFVKGQYSELYMHSPGVFKDVLRVRPCMADYWASTTDASDKSKMAEASSLLEKNLGKKPSLEEVIEELTK